jgi:tetratricopeptide (TPR) repeat protein
MTGKTSEVQQTLGAKIRAKRLEQGFNQQDLLAGRYSEAYLSRVERDKLTPSEDFLDYLAKRLHVPMQDLIKDTSLAQHYETQASAEMQEFELKNAEVALLAGNTSDAKKYLFKIKVKELAPASQAYYYYLLGKAEMELGDNGAALPDLQNSLKLYEAINPKIPELELERVRHLIGLVYYRQNNYTLALEYHQHCHEAIQEGRIVERYFRFQVYFSLANDFQGLGKYTQAMELYKEAVKLADDIVDMQRLASAYWGLALALRSKGNLGQAMLYLDKSAILYESIHELKLASTVKGILGVIQVDEQRFDQAEKSLETSLEIASKLDDNESVAKALVNLAYLRYSQKNLSEADKLASEGVEKLHALQNQLSLGQGLAQLADIKLAEGQIEECLKCYQEAIALLEAVKAGDFLTRIYIRYAGALEKSGNITEAIAVYHKAFNYKESTLYKTF